SPAGAAFTICCPPRVAGAKQSDSRAALFRDAADGYPTSGRNAGLGETCSPFALRCGSVVQHPLKLFDFVPQARITAKLVLDLSDRMQDGRVIAVAEPAADLRQRPGSELLGQIHADLPRPNHRTMPPLREDVAL